jgi:hypothetical protein
VHGDEEDLKGKKGGADRHRVVGPTGPTSWPLASTLSWCRLYLLHIQMGLSFGSLSVEKWADGWRLVHV